ncbi:LADA_0A03246g1_1 [Lachancea dasiensis]|uniref:LADA_0A03246g1_1 n=1 Tax=Lachancea dasiensis TaxID=1072105 RepID=A0A1G4ING9_9SACH|nr:LADA_0A03246g1_1 [Lachancea dasiensis]
MSLDSVMETKESEQQMISTTPHVELELEKLPRDVFRYKLQYWLTRHWLVLSALASELCVALYCFNLAQQHTSGDDLIGLSIMISMGAVIICLLSALVANAIIHTRVTSPSNKLAFMREIVSIKPGFEISDWDTIAAKLNPIFYANSSLVPYFFYDGASCYSFFRTTYLRPFLARKELANSWGGFFGRVQPPVDDLQPFIDQAIGIYEERANKDWQEMLGGSSSGAHDMV